MDRAQVAAFVTALLATLAVAGLIVVVTGTTAGLQALGTLVVSVCAIVGAAVHGNRR